MDSGVPLRLDSEAAWKSLLERQLDCAVDVVFGRSRTHPIQMRTLDRARQGVLIRLHGMFAAAPLEIGEAVAKWLRSGRRARKACAQLDAWIEAQLEELAPPAPRQATLVTRGEVHDLAALSAPLYEQEFAGEFQAVPGPPTLTWGRRARSRTRHSIRLGSFVTELNLVRIHPALDQAGVPDWFVRTVLFHEILHAARPPRRGSGKRWVHHDAEFRTREAAYRDHDRALRWEEKNLSRLLASARRGTPMRVRREDLGVEEPRRRTGLLGFIQRELF